ncbi:unnamed protein product [Mytilus coruscus]|uniref:Uncharacterized protein n=1 Tax=Mytilus coruscus TaxID=42192 RepID=A0A6J8AEP2_MYTCO|nr:unnamed protein product [Mytilus coruscus]
MGFDKDIVKQDCGCYTKYWSHDSFNYSGSDHFTVCLKHKMHNSAKQMNFTEWKSSLKRCADDLRGKMKSEKIKPLLRQKYLLTTNDEERLVKISDEKEKTTELLLTLYKLGFNPLPQRILPPSLIEFCRIRLQKMESGPLHGIMGQVGGKS